MYQESPITAIVTPVVRRSPRKFPWIFAWILPWASLHIFPWTFLRRCSRDTLTYLRPCRQLLAHLRQKRGSLLCRRRQT
ncbi:hypothetical protein BDV23DRAFT_155451 [Aspergillus alliaceus]|uniref:Uncharacterized protein n=1 Tax=Petromyces alliaceus TaxID=209559 RepID=A0A5N7C834_PETAA|nr:hypothetical protein BDV23DRAFT_155451 [Aspergillus alliaceus]